MGTKYDTRWSLAIGQAFIEGLLEGLDQADRLPSSSLRLRAQAYLNTRRTDRCRARRMDRFVSVRSYMANVVAAALVVEYHVEE